MRLPHLPGPKGHLVVGSYPEMRKDVLAFYTEQVRLFGDLSLHKIFHIPVVVVGAPHLIEQVFVQQESKLEKSFDYAELRRVVGRGLLTSEGEEHKKKRRLIQPSFTHDKIAEYGRVMTRRAKARLDRWQDGAVVDVHHEMSAITLEIIAETMLGVDLEGDARTVADALDGFMRQFEAMIASAIPVPLWVPTPGNIRSFARLREMDEVLFRIIGARRARLERDGDTPDDLLGRLLLARFDAGSPLTERELRDELITMVMAGHETTALALTWTVMLLTQQPDVNARLLDELDAVLAGRPPALDDIGRLVFARQVVDEALRLYPPAWGVGRQVRKGETLVLDGHEIPGGTQVSALQWVTHRDARFWPDPLRFDPDRFAPAGANGAAIVDKGRPKYAYFPFAGGPRSCVGMHFALMEAVLVLAETMQRFSFELAEPDRIDLMPAVTLRPRHGLKARVAMRERVRAARAA